MTRRVARIIDLPGGGAFRAHFEREPSDPEVAAVRDFAAEAAEKLAELPPSCLARNHAVTLLPCLLEPGHDGKHRTGRGVEW